MKKLYIFRGISGAGKSTYARTLAPLVIEPDMFRYDENNEYVFDSDRNSEVYAKAQLLCRFAMRELEMPVLAVTAAFSSIDKFMPYVDLGRRYGYDVTVVECSGSFRNVHAVPEKVLAAMREKYEPLSAARAAELGVNLRIVRDGKPVEAA